MSSTATADPFASPGSSGGVKWDDHLGRLLLIIPNGVEEGISTAFGPKDAVRADVTVLDGPNVGAEYPDALIFPGVLIGQLRPRIGQRVLGRLSQGNAKPGQKPPWRLDEATEADKQLGLKYLAGTLTSPSSDSDKPPF